MALHLKDQHQRSQLHSRITRDLDKRLTKKPATSPAVPAKAHARHNEGQQILSLRGAWFVVLVTGGCVSILVALVERQNPAAISGDIDARSLALLGVAMILLGIIGLLIGRHKSHK